MKAFNIKNNNRLEHNENKYAKVMKKRNDRKRDERRVREM